MTRRRVPTEAEVDRRIDEEQAAQDEIDQQAGERKREALADYRKGKLDTRKTLALLREHVRDCLLPPLMEYQQTLKRTGDSWGVLSKEQAEASKLLERFIEEAEELCG